MVHLSLYRKYRPQTFAEILGQDHVSQTLANAIVEDRVAHAYLFTGPRGTGKTSTARILAKALNCETGPTPSPCGECPPCRAISDGSSLDVIEMDAASHSKVDETREILAGVPLATAGGRKKVYVIDEVHMLSSGSFNALLKTLEEPPGHVLFILATTEAHKVLSTIVSRTQRFDFRRIPSEILESHLAKIAAAEEIDVEPEALAIVARHAEGGARDALSALDQLGSIADRITVQDVELLFGLREEDSYFELFDAVAQGDVGRVFQTTHALIGQGADPRRLAIGVLGHARSLLLLRAAPDAGSLLDVGAEDLVRLSDQARQLSPEHLLRVLDLMGKAITDMRLAPNHRLLLEVALVRAADPATDPSALGLQGRIERLERRIGIAEGAASSAQPAPVPAPQPAPRASSQETSRAAPPSREPARRTPSSLKTAPSSGGRTAPPTSEAVGTAAASTTPAPAVEAPATASPPPGGAVGFAQIKEAWQATMQEVGRRSKRIQALLNPSRPLGYENGHLSVEVQSTFHESTMAEASNAGLLAEAVFAVLGVRPSVGFVARGSAGTPASAPAAEAPAAPTAEQQKEELAGSRPIEDSELDPVELIKEGLGAEVIEERTT